MNLPPLHRIDYDTVDGKFVDVVKSEIYAWAPVNTETGAVGLDSVEMFDDTLRELAAPWQWVRFTLTPSENQ